MARRAGSRRLINCILPGLIVAFGSGVLNAQSISSIGASLNANSPVIAQGITAGTSLPSITLQISGVFDPVVFQSVTWTDPRGPSAVFTLGNGIQPPVTANLIFVTIPQTLYQNVAGTPLTVGITVQHQTTTSNSFPFTINPPLLPVLPLMPVGTFATPYSSPLFTGGTPALITPDFAVNLVTGAPPPATFLPAVGRNLTGAPDTLGVFTFQVSIRDVWANQITPTQTLQVVTDAVVTTLSPTSIPAKTPGQQVVITGQNFVAPLVVGTQNQPGSTATWTVSGGNPLPLATTFNNANQITATVPAGLLGTPGTAVVNVLQPNSSLSPTSQTFTITVPPLSITNINPPPGTVGTPYSFTFIPIGGVAPFQWAGTGFPPGLLLNPNTGVLSGVPTAAGSFPSVVSVKDAASQSAGLNPTFTVNSAVAPVVILNSSNLPDGTIGIPYNLTFTASGGTPGYSFGATGGLPNGLSLDNNGQLYGTPTKAGDFRFTVTATDNANATGSKGFTLTIVAPPVTVTGSVSDTTVGSAINAKFGGAGGVGGPFTIRSSGSLPAGTSLATDGTLSGTATTAGTFTFTITAVDSGGNSGSRSFTVRITPASLAINPAALANGQVGVAYSAQVSASGGVPSYTLSLTGLPPGLSFSNGTVSGTPTAAGDFNVTATARDSAGTSVTRTYTVTILPARLSITTASLPDGTVNNTYGATLGATGGVEPYSWAITGTPAGITGSAAGTLSGAPTAAGSFTINVVVADAKGSTASASFRITIATAPLVITGTFTSAVAGTAVNTRLSPTGGIGPYTFSATGLPPGLSLSTDGVLTGTPTAPGSVSFVVTVRDSSGASTTRTFTVSITLPATPGVNLTGPPATTAPGSQSRLQVGIGAPYPVDVVVTLNMGFVADFGADDPTIVFSSGGRTARLTIPAGSTSASSDVGVQLGTVAGTVTITSQLSAANQDITPSPAPTRTVRVSAGPPVVVSVVATRTATGFNVITIGYASDRQLTQASFQFTGAAGGNLQTTQLTVPVDTVFTQWYQSSASVPFGSQFAFTQSFTVNGSTTAIQSVSVTLVNRLGNSNVVTATLQ